MTLKQITNSIPFRLAIVFAILFVIYIGFVQLWKLTSPEYQPVGAFDHVVRKSPPVDRWYLARREHGSY